MLTDAKEAHLVANVGELLQQMRDAGYWIHSRIMEAARLKERLVLLALKQTLQPRAARFFIHDTYAGLPGRGGHRAVERAMAFQRRVASPDAPQSGWLLKTDVRHFYPGKGG